MTKKYELGDKHPIKDLYQVVALTDFGDVKAGDRGGWIESERNLSQEGNCWIFDDAQVCGYAHISGNAQVYGNAQVSGNTMIIGNAQVYGNAQVCGRYQICWISGYARVYGNCLVSYSIHEYTPHNEDENDIRDRSIDITREWI